jgi:exodeoxyribonuclease V alpha subunit
VTIQKRVLDQKFEYLNGVLEKVIYRDEDSGFSVIKVKTSNHRDLITAVGSTTPVYAGERVEVQGNWSNNSKYGLEFKIHFLRSLPPNSSEDIERYLGSGLIKGVGPFFAKKLVASFADEVFDVIENQPERLGKIDGIGERRANLIRQSWNDQRSIREIMLFLHSHNISIARAVKIYRVYGENAIKIVSENPYKLAREISGIGFLSADKIAQSLGIKADSIMRLKAGINYILSEALNEGHCGLPTELLIQRSEALLSVDRELLLQALNEEVKEHFLVKDSVNSIETIFLFQYYLYEKNIASKIKELSGDKPQWAHVDMQKVLEWLEGGLAISLAHTQVEAIHAVLNEKVVVITGGPGTGKTTIVNAIVTVLKAKKFKVILCAPTGRAAKRLSESTGHFASTIHRLLKYEQHTHQFSYNQNKLLDCDALIIDESSMVEVQLMFHLLKAIPMHASLIFVGDIDQLPSIGPGQVLKDIIEAQSIHTVRLNKIFRQGADSQIITNAYLVNKGMLPKFEDDARDFYFIETQIPEEIPEKILHVVSHVIPEVHSMNSIKDAQVLCPMQRGSCGAKSLNIALQKILNPNASDGIQRFGQTFAPGDKVMQLSNNYDKEVYNGDIGVVTDIDAEEQNLLVDFEGRPVHYSFEELDELSIAYAITIHKAQGSEYPVVIIPFSTQHFPMLQKKLLYTAITRGKKLVFLVGQKKAVAIAVKNQKELNRFSKLKEWLAARINT